ncbi:MAG TPA: DUF1425 domain-containing protein [Tepidisphaeraceae bacterium]|nr:DUF1425 domain-containing protein [Tepidisphaeraceae bacterium]
MTQLLKTFSMIFAALMVVGCNQPRGPIEPNAVAFGNSRQIYADSYKLKEQTNIDEPPRMTKDQFGLLHIMVPVRSTIDRPFTLQYRVTFFDRDHQVASQQNWSDLAMNPNTPERIETASSGPAEDFEVDLRLPPGFSD